MAEGSLVQECVGVLRSILQSMSARTVHQPLLLPEGVDAVCEVFLPGRPAFQLCAFVRKGLRPATLPELLERIKRIATAEEGCDQVIVFTDYVPAPLADRLRERRVNFVDTTGNAYLGGPGQISVFHVGNRPPRQPASQGQFFSESGAKILFYLLRHGPSIEATYRDMREDICVSLDKISKVMNELAAERAVAPSGRGRYEILDPATLLGRWSEAFAAKLAPKTLLGRFMAADGSDFTPLLKILATHTVDAVVGGEVAADLLTGHLRAGSMRLYVSSDNQAKVRANLRLAPARGGNIELCKAFAADLGEMSRKHGVRLADPVLVYAELMSGDDVRLGETALRLKEQYLSWIE
jgi:hypothetical protein